MVCDNCPLRWDVKESKPPCPNQKSGRERFVEMHDALRRANSGSVKRSRT